MAAYAALVSVMNNIEQIQRHTRLPIHFDKTQSDSLLEKVNFLTEFLETYNYHGAAEEMKGLESRITDAAYAAEDIVETHVVNTINPKITKFKRIPRSRSMATWRKNRRSRKTVPTTSMKKQTLPCLHGSEKVMQDMESIMEEAVKLKGRNETQHLHPATSPIIGPSRSSGKNTIVGFDDELKQIMEWLLARQSSLRVIPIVGMGGIGKTTLAKTAYDKLKDGTHFDYCAWVTISQEYDFKKIILGLLGRRSSQSDLGQMLHKSLYGRRYLIVLDDMWSVEAWEMVMRFLPDNNNK